MKQASIRMFIASSFMLSLLLWIYNLILNLYCVLLHKVQRVLLFCDFNLEN